jgi:hypothetical protein
MEGDSRRPEETVKTDLLCGQEPEPLKGEDGNGPEEKEVRVELNRGLLFRMNVEPDLRPRLLFSLVRNK